MALSYRKTRDQMQSEGSVVGVLQLPKGVDLLKIEKAGSLVIQILPYTVPAGAKHPYAQPGEQHFFRPYGIFRNLGITGKKVALDCRTTFKPSEKCAASEFFAEEWTPPEDKPDAKRPRSQRKALVNLYAVEEGKHYVFDYSAANFIEALFEAVDQKSQVLNPVTKKPKYPDLEYFADPEYGWVITVQFTEETFAGAKYYKASNFEFDRGEPVPQEIRDLAVDLDTMLIRPSYSEVKAMIHGEDFGSDEETPAVPAPAAPVEKPAPKAPPKPVTKQAEEPKPEPVVEDTVPSETAEASEPVIELAVGSIRHHPTYGQVEVVKVRDGGKAVVSDKNEDMHTVPVDSLSMFPAEVEFTKPEAKKPATRAPKKTTTPAPTTGGADEPFPDWE